VSTPPLFLGIDLGTQSVRAIAARSDGTVAARGSRPLRSRRSGARHEQDSDGWWPALAGACRDALRDVASGSVRALAVCATSGTIVLVDRGTGAALTPALMYDDERDLAWILREWPELAACGRLAHQADVVTRRLTGEDVPADCSHALKSGFDLVGEHWPEALDGLDVPGGLLPAVVASGTALGTVCAEAASQTAISAGTPVIAGMTDGCAAQIAAGALREGDWVSVLGTTLVLKGYSSQLIRDPDGVVYSHRAPDGGWLPGGAASAGAGVLAARFPGADLAALDRSAGDHERTPVLAYPLAGRGERFPFTAPDAEGFVVGEPADDAEQFAALLQGVAFVERLCFAHLAALGAPTGGRLTLTGGGSASRYWCQLRADVLRRPVRLVQQSESAFGMAILAAAAVAGGKQAADVADVAARMSRTREVVEPRRDRGEHFDERYASFVDELVRRGWLARDAAV